MNKKIYKWFISFYVRSNDIHNANNLSSFPHQKKLMIFKGLLRISCVKSKVSDVSKNLLGKFFCTLGMHLHTPAQIETGKQEELLWKWVGQKFGAAGLVQAPNLQM